MMKKTVDSIRKTELEAIKIVEDARLQVDEKRKAAQALAKQSQADAIAKAQAQAAQDLAEAQKKGNEILASAQKEAVDAANVLRANVAKKEAAAIKLVMEHLI